MEELIHGAKWWKFDFHNHTPKSNDFGKGNTSHMEIKPEEWLLMYMAAEIDCVAITDHNSGEWVDTLKHTLATMQASRPAGYRELYLFPGVEISASGNTHILAIFDITADTKKIQALLGAVGFPTDKFGTSDAVTDKSVEAVISEIHKAGGIAIPAHVDQPSGLFKSQKGQTLKQILNVEGLLALEVISKSESKPDIYTQAKLNLAEVVGSDSHIAAQVGARYTWVKMGEPSLDALRLALHDKEDGVIRYDETSDSPNITANRYFIKSLRVENGYKAGNGSVPLKPEFSPWLTSIIGGRGSGKSTILNYLRIGLSRKDEMPPEVQEEFDNFNSIKRSDGTGMLRENTTIEIEIFKEEKLYLIKWINNIYYLHEWDGKTNSWGQAQAVSNIKELFPIQVFSQKELFAITSNPSKLLELIDSQFDKSSWIDSRERLIGKWIADGSKYRQLEKDIAEEANIIAQLSLVKNKIALMESSEYKEVLGSLDKLSGANQFFTDASNAVENFVKQLDSLIQDFPNIKTPEKITDVIGDDAFQFIQSIQNVLQESQRKLIEVASSFDPYRGNLSSQINRLSWFKSFTKSREAYKEIEEKINELGKESYDALINRRSSLMAKQERIATYKQEFETLKASLHTTYTLILDKERELRSLRNKVISRWKPIDGADKPFLTIELQPMADVENADATFRQLLRKSGGEFAASICERNEDGHVTKGLIADIVNEPEATRWDKREQVLSGFLSATVADKKNLDLRLVKHLDSLKQNTPEDIDRLRVWVPADKLILKFEKDGKQQDIQTGSAGERTAGMLGLVLALKESPLIIDQPEDDLDSRLISSFVVDGIKKLKQKRQIVIVTHNPNITVNANSDNVIHMDFVNGQVVVAGNNALQDRKIRNAVCEIMEGGKAALDSRYYRVSKALKP
jgi:ABC-type lipoprotein export system ATPase subunit/predicted metal-dependent phosphoesterase TrpH